MTSILAEINWLAVFAGGIIYMFVGGLWYGPIAGKAWLEEMGMTEEEVKASGSPTGAMIKSFIASLFLTFGMAFLFNMMGITNADWIHGAISGAFMALLIVGAATFPNYAFESKTTRHFIIHLGSTTVAMTLVGAMLAAWQ
ncbi:DUF1761 domain-containing protein [Kordiimonas aquimaris]|uniref:DUF1761 domain-containing protein n=1 Tax=Kordiimonas aquimaris TaxID=707591 RepID=UPI0021CF45D6|nr:DUF1761 domain-containing protein [Kordiimonas aquimaris]